MILKHFPLSPTPLSSLLSRTWRGTDKLGTPTCHHPWSVSRAGVRAYTFVCVFSQGLFYLKISQKAHRTKVRVQLTVHVHVLPEIDTKIDSVVVHVLSYINIICQNLTEITRLPGRTCTWSVATQTSTNLRELCWRRNHGTLYYLFKPCEVFLSCWKNTSKSREKL